MAVFPTLQARELGQALSQGRPITYAEPKRSERNLKPVFYLLMLRSNKTFGNKIKIDSFIISITYS